MLVNQGRIKRQFQSSMTLHYSSIVMESQSIFFGYESVHWHSAF